MAKTRILFVLDSLEGGGAQRVALNILRYINKQDFEPVLAVINFQGDYLDILPRHVAIHDLKAGRARYAIANLAHLIGDVNPALLFSTTPYIDEIVCIAALISRRKVKTILRSPNYVSAMLKQLPIYTRLMAKYSYRRADMIITTTQLMTQDLKDKFGIPADRIRLIHNPLDLETIKVLSKETIGHPWFQSKRLSKMPIVISMGRLVDQKGFPDLIRAFAIVVRKLPARLAILGQGRNLQQLQALAKSMGITHNVLFCGFQPNPYKYIANSSVFVLPSHWEGFPNSLVEAMACGVPVVSTDCPSGPGEIIAPDQNGLLVPVKDPEALAEAIMMVLGNMSLRRRLTNGARRRSQDFSIGNIVKEYECMFKSISALDAGMRCKPNSRGR